MKTPFFTKTIFTFFLILLFVFSHSVWGQTTTIDFETAGDGYTPSTTSGSGSTDVFNRTNPNIGGNASYIWAVEDLLVTDPSITLDQIDVTGATSFTFSIDFLTPNTEDWDVSDELLITYSIDGGAYQNLMWVQSNKDNDDYNAPAALDLNFDGTGDDGEELPAITDDFGAGVGSNFATFTTSSISLSGNSTLDIQLQFNGLDATAEGIYIDNIVITQSGGTPTPTITVSESAVNFNNVYAGNASLPELYTVEGTDLTDDITITAPTGYEVSTSCSSGYGSSVTLTQSGGTVSQTTVYLRFAPSGTSTYSGNVTHASTGATTQNIAVNETNTATNLPAGYYSTATGTGRTLLTNLHKQIDQHTKRTYDNLWTDFQTTDDRANGTVWDMYSDKVCSTDPYEFTFITEQCGSYGVEGDCYNREHSFPKSWWGGTTDTMYTDLFHLVPTDGKVNGQRGSWEFGEVGSPTWTSQNGSKLGPNTYSGSSGATAFEPVDDYKGDFARAYFYMAVRYASRIQSWTTSPMVDGDINDADGSVFEEWALNMLIEWHTNDPVDQKELNRNDAIYSIQDNRNPFIDNPSYVDAIWGSNPALAVSPATLTGFSYEEGSGPSTSQSFALSGTDLDGTQVTITAPTNYEISTDNATFQSSITVSYTAPTLSSTTIYVRLKAGLSAATYNGETVTCNDNGTASNVTVSNDGEVTTAGGGGSCGFIISEYVEGSSNNKYIELYNGTGSTLDLTGYEIRLYANGATSPNSTENLSGNLADGATLVFKNSSATIYSGTATVSAVCSFNGNDAIALFDGTSNIDVVGTIGSSSNFAEDVTLVRKSTVTDPNSTYTSSEWDSYAQDYISDLGSHTMNCGSSNDNDTQVYEPTTQISGANIASTETGFSNVFSIEIQDQGTADGEVTDVTNIRLKPHTTNTADWTDHISAIKLNNGSDITLGTVDITDTYIDIPIPAGNLQIADGGSDVVTVQLKINNTGITDGAVLSFMVDADDHGFTADASGSGFAASFLLGDFNSNDFTVDVTLDELRFTQQPSDVYTNIAVSPAVTIAATDANGNVDTDFDGAGCAIGLTTTGTFAGSATTQVDAVDGVATFSNLVFSATAENRTLTTTDPDSWGWSNITSNAFNVSTGPLFYQDFGADGGNWNYTPNPATFNSGSDVWDVVTSSFHTFGTIPSSKSNFFGVQDLDSPSGTSGWGTLTFDQVSVNGYENVSITFDYEVDDFDSGDDLKYEYFEDGTSQGETLLVDGYSNLDADGTVTINISDAANTCQLVISINQNGDDYAGIDNVKLTGTASVSCTHSISSFAPESGPVGTEVKISGSGFTESSTVDFGGTAATVRFVDENTLIAEVPSGTSSGKINVTESSCTTQSSSDFSLIEESGTCGSGSGSYTDVFISEIYDAQSGSLGYIELYNGTGSDIDLSAYSIKRFNDDAGSSTHTYTFPSTTIIASGGTLLGRVSTESNVSGITPDFTFEGSTAGFNDKDRLELWDESSQIDEVIAQAVSAAGYSYWRKTDANAPSVTFDSNDWTYSETEDASNMGNFATMPAPTISAQPTDANSCSVSMSVTASGTSLTYQWKYNDGNSPNWSDVSSGDFSPASVSGETSDALSISGTDINNFDGYQFYCQVTESGSCSSASHAAQFVITPERYFRSKQSGNWNDATSWEMSADGSSGWADACTYPTSSNTDEITVLNGHSLSIVDDAGSDPDLLINQLTINEGGQLTIPATAEMHINNAAAGADLVVNGTLQDNSSSGAGNGITFNSGATWQLGANGTIIKTRNSGLGGFRDQYEGGISTIPATANWYFRYEGNLLSVLTIGMYYPNLYFESNSGDYALSNSIEIFGGSSDIATVKGNLDIGGSGSGSVSVYNENTNASPMLIVGDLIVRSGSALLNSSGSTAGTGFEVRGDLTVEGTLDVNSASTGLLKFSGTNEQTFSGNGTIDLYDVEVNKPAEKIILSTAHTDIENDLSIAGGTLQLAEGKWLTVGNTLTNSVGASGLLLKSNGTSTASLIHPTAGIPATVERALLGQTWQYIFAPLSQIEQSYFTTTNYGETNPNFYFYDETQADYWNASSIYGTTGWTKPTDQYLQTDRGYLLWERHARRFVQTGGSLQAADKDFALSYTTSGAGNTPEPIETAWTNFDGWNLIGNPYAAAVDWDNGAIDKTNMNNMVYFYDGASKNYKYYGDAGASVNGATQYIPAGQAFFVKVSANKTLTLPAAAREHNNQSFYKNESKGESVKIAIEKGSFSDETLIRSIETATLGFDNAHDAYKMFSLDKEMPQIYTFVENEKTNFAINSLPEIEGSTVVPLGFYAGSGGEFVLRLREKSLDLPLYLEDRENDIWTLLDNESYTFSASESSENRFFLHFALATTSISTPFGESRVQVFPNPLREKFFVQFGEQPQSLVTGTLYDMQGTRIKEFAFQEKKHCVTTAGLDAGIYLLKINYHGEFFVQKLVVQP